MMKKILLLLAISLTLPLHAQLIDNDSCTRADQELTHRARTILEHLPIDLSRNSYILPQASNNRIFLVGQARDAATQKQIVDLLQKQLQESSPPLNSSFSIESKIELATPIETKRRIADNFLYVPVQQILAHVSLRNYPVRFIVVDANLYLMGVVTREQGNQIVTALSTLGGLNKIIKVFEYVNS